MAGTFGSGTFGSGTFADAAPPTGPGVAGRAARTQLTAPAGTFSLPHFGPVRNLAVLLGTGAQAGTVTLTWDPPLGGERTDGRPSCYAGIAAVDNQPNGDFGYNTASNAEAGVGRVSFTGVPGATAFTATVSTFEIDGSNGYSERQQVSFTTPAATPGIAGPRADLLAAAPAGTAGRPGVGGGIAGQVALLGVRAPGGAADAYQIDRSRLVLTLTLLEDTVQTQPGSVQAAIGNGTPDAVVYLFVDGVEVLNTRLDSTGAVAQLNAPVMGLTAGPHDLSVSESPTAPDAGELFTCLTEDRSIDPIHVEPPEPYVVVNRWTLQSYYRNDYYEFDTYVLPRNPTTAEQKYGDRAVSSEPTTAGGHIVSWEGLDQPPTWTITGRVFTEAEHDEMVSWARNNRRVFIVDHHGQRYSVAMAGITLQRVRDIARPWHHKYSMTMFLLDPTGVSA